MMFQLGLIDSQFGVVLVLTGGLLPAAIFILKDFMDAIPRSYEESARVFGASPAQILRHIVLPVVRPGLATVGRVGARAASGATSSCPTCCSRVRPSSPRRWSCTRSTRGRPAEPRADLGVRALYSIPVVVLYLFVNRRYGFRFHGGIKS